MELWIRSQDKTSLIKVNKLIFERNIDDEPTIYGYERYDNYERLGIYKTKERTLEVLDEIQNILLLKDMYVSDKEELLKGWEKFNQDEIKSMRTKLAVYEMPQE